MICLSVWTFVTYYFDATKVVNQAGFPARNRLRKKQLYSWLPFMPTTTRSLSNSYSCIFPALSNTFSKA